MQQIETKEIKLRAGPRLLSLSRALLEGMTLGYHSDAQEFGHYSTTTLCQTLVQQH